MLNANFAALYIEHGQGNDDVKMQSKTSHINTMEEATDLATVLNHGGEFGEKFLTTTQYELAPKVVPAFTAGEITAKRGRLHLELEFESSVVGETGQKHYITIEDYLNDNDLIQLVIAKIKAIVPGAWVGINKAVKTVNFKFTEKKGA